MLPNSILHHLLFVDDDEDDFLIFAEALKEINAEVQVTYLSGFDQLKNLNRSDFDLIFLDINMPAVNGIECLKRLKETNLKNLPVVMYST
ncbi:MAG: response regulator, partial [Chitinophagaceae bacterium]